MVCGIQRRLVITKNTAIATIIQTQPGIFEKKPELDWEVGVGVEPLCIGRCVELKDV